LGIINTLIRPFVDYLPENNRIERIWKLAQVDFKKRYYNDRLGLLWALIKPLIQVTVYYTVFATVFKIEKENYALFLFCGIIFWGIFTDATTRGIKLLSDKKYLIENIQFNRLDLYYSFILSILIGFLFNFGAFFLMSIFNGNYPDYETLFFPVVILNLLIISMGFTMILSCFQPFVKDIQHAWDMIILILFWTSGIFFEAQQVLDEQPWMLYANPFLGIIDTVHGSCLIDYELNFYYLFLNFIQSALILLLGIWVHRSYGYLAVEKL